MFLTVHSKADSNTHGNAVVLSVAGDVGVVRVLGNVGVQRLAFRAFADGRQVGRGVVLLIAARGHAQLGHFLDDHLRLNGVLETHKLMCRKKCIFLRIFSRFPMT